jgi:hypothetical protein
MVVARAWLAVAVWAVLVVAQVLPAAVVWAGTVVVRVLPAVAVSAGPVVPAVSVGLSLAAPGSQGEMAELEDWLASRYPVSSADWLAAPVLFQHLEHDLAELDLVCRPMVALLVVAGPVWSLEDLRHCTADVQLPGGCRELVDGRQEAGSASCRHSPASQSTRSDADDTRHSVGDTVSPILPKARGCSTRGARPNSIPSRPNPMAGCW